MISLSPPLKRFNIIWTTSETERPSIAPDDVHGNWQCIWGCHQSGQKERKHSGWAAAASQSLDKKGRLTHSLTVTGCQGRCSLRHLHLKAIRSNTCWVLLEMGSKMKFVIKKGPISAWKGDPTVQMFSFSRDKYKGHSIWWKVKTFYIVDFHSAFTWPGRETSDARRAALCIFTVLAIQNFAIGTLC